MMRPRRTSSSGSIRRSSVSARDIQAIQQALQKQKVISNQVISILVLILPFFSLFYQYAIFVKKGALWATISSCCFQFPFIAQLLPPIFDVVAWKITIVVISLQMILYWILPHDTVTVLSTSIGIHDKNVNGFASFLLMILLYPLGSSLKLYRPDLVFLHFHGVMGCLCVLALLIMLLMYVSYRFGEHNTIDTLSEFFFGIDVYPTFLDIDLKHFLRTRITLMVWTLYTISALFYQKHTLGYIQRGCLCTGALNIFYIAKSMWNEDIMLNSLDSRRAKCGFYRIWGDLVLFPLMYCTPMCIIAQQGKSVSLPACIVFSLCALAGIAFVSVVDRQRYNFRLHKGIVKIDGHDPFFIAAKYKTETGESAFNLLLGSGYWGICRHPNYICESVIFFALCILQGFQPILCYFPTIFMTSYLAARMLNDENRCLLKYGQYWIQHCTKVPFRLFPGIY